MNSSSAVGAQAWPVTYSILSADWLLDEVRRAYGLEGLETCRLLQRGFNDSYVITGRRGRWIARVYGAGWRTTSDVAYELELLDHLARCGIGVPSAIRADGQPAVQLETPEGTRQLVLVTLVEGRPLAWDEPADCELAGRTTAAFHTAAESFQSPQRRLPFDLVFLIDAQLELLRPFFDDRAEWAELVQIAAELRIEAGARVHELSWGICLNDLAPGTFRIGDDGRISIVDLDFAAPCWRSYDLAGAHWMAASRKQGDIRDAFVRGYLEVRALSMADLDAAPLFSAIRRLWSLGMKARSARALGSYRLGTEYVEPELRLLREAGGDNR
jgi:Ser/Thr protein kinase RdoA (MazF antagonist)